MKRMPERFLALLLCLLLCLSLFPAAACADTGSSPLSGVCGDELRWTLDEQGTLTVTGSGAMWDYTREYVDGESEFTGSPFVYECSVKKLVIGPGVTSIGAYAFHNIPEDWYGDAGCSGLVSVSLPDSLTKIGDHAFTGCGELAD